MSTGRARPRWWDPRLAIGLTLVAGSVAGVVWIVAGADSTVVVLTAREPLSPGDRVRVGDLVPQRVHVGGVPSRYLNALPAGGVVVVRAVGAGELIPRSAVGDPRGLRVRSVVVPITGTLSRSIDSGSVVDVWAARAGEGRVFEPPVVLVASATVVRVNKADGLAQSGQGTAIEILVSRSRIARVLESIANADAISLVPVSLPLVG